MITPTDPEQDRRAVLAALDSQRDDLRRLVARYRLGAFLNDLDAIGAAVGDGMNRPALVMGMQLALLLDSLDDGPADREWRQRTYGTPA